MHVTNILFWICGGILLCLSLFAAWKLILVEYIHDAWQYQVECIMMHDNFSIKISSNMECIAHQNFKLNPKHTIFILINARGAL